MHYPAQGKTGGKISPLFASKNVHYLSSLDLPTYMILSVTSIEEFPGDGYSLS